MRRDTEYMGKQAVSVDDQHEAAKRWAIRGLVKFLFLSAAIAVGVYIGVSLAA